MIDMIRAIATQTSARLAPRRRRAATFIEYVILAGIAVVIGAIILGGFTGVFNKFFSNFSL